MPFQVQRSWFAWFIAGYVLYALAFIYNSSSVVDGRRHFLLLDDAMISMTYYARSLANGHGAVWYPGADPVQGYSNPLWMLFMALVHCLPLPPSMTSLPIQLAGVALIGATLYFVKLIAERFAAASSLAAHAGPKRGSTPAQPTALAPFFAVLLTAFYLPLNNWTLRGMEVGAVALGITLAVWAAIQCADGKSYQWWLLPLLGLLTMVRMDAAVAGVCILLWLLWAVPQRRWPTLVWAACLAFFLIGQMLVQKLYYHDWLPNTYYLKLAGIPFDRRIAWGSYVFFHFCTGVGLWLLMAAALYATAERSKAIWLLVAVIAGQVGYSIYVGGDAWEWWGGANRYLCVAMPLFFTLVAGGLARFRDLLAGSMARMSPQNATAVVVVLGFLALIQANSYQFTLANSLAQSLLLQKPPEWDGHDDMLRTALAIQKVATPQARVAVIWAGIVPYFSERTPIDLLGKCDRKIAHGPDEPFEPPPLPFFRSAPVPYCWPGHTKRDYRYSIHDLRPDVIQRWYGMDKMELSAFLQQQYIVMQAGDMKLIVNKDSKEIKF